jgi:hypothetical protein|tara:strand:+ start:486 stop:653 length:168 start_codon:yes stop_codon:yes gene_type:complete
MNNENQDNSDQEMFMIEEKEKTIIQIQKDQGSTNLVSSQPSIYNKMGVSGQMASA